MQGKGRRGVLRRLLAVVATVVVVLAPGAGSAMPRNPRFETLSVDDGLPQDTVSAVLQDHQGFLWIGTQAGLARYDGYRYTLFQNDPADPSSLGDNYVTALLEDDQGRLWVGTRGGLFRLDAGRRRFESIAPPESAGAVRGRREINALLAERDGAPATVTAVWVATTKGLERIDTRDDAFETWRQNDAHDSRPASDGIQSLAADPLGGLWIGSGMGLDRWDRATRRFSHYPVGSGRRDNVVQTLHWSHNGRLWIGTQSGVRSWRPDAEAAPRIEPADLPADDIRALLETADGAIWIGTYASGLYRYDPAGPSLTNYRHQAQDSDSLASNDVQSLYVDRSDTLWIGSWTGGVSRLGLRGGGFERYLSVSGDAASLSDSRVRGVTGDRRGSIWLATMGGGINRLDTATGRFRSYLPTQRPGEMLLDLRVNCIAIDGGGGIWAGTVGGLARVDPAAGRYTLMDLGALPAALESVFALQFDGNGDLWIGTEGGALRRRAADGGLDVFVSRPDRSDSLPPGRVAAFLLDRDGTLWIGTYSGLARLERDRGSFTRFHHDPARADSLSQDRVNDLFEDRAGRLWVSTAGGLNRVDSKNGAALAFHAYSRHDGLASDVIGKVLEGHDGELWISTIAGLSRLDVEHGAIRNFGAGDGLITGSFYVNSGYADSDGRLYFGGQHGLLSFLPTDIASNPLPPEVRITELRVFNAPVRGDARPADVAFDGDIGDAGELRLGPAAAVFSLEFAALHFSDPARNRYAHQLVGVDPDWVLTGADQRSATYTNLDAGRYTFRVRAANKDGVWNETGASLMIVVVPPWWRTWWFRLALLAAAVSAVAAVIRLRVRGLEQQRLQLAQEVSARTSEVVRQRDEIVQQKELLELGRNDLSVLGEIGREITATLDQDAVVRTLDRNVHALLEVTTFAIYLLDAPGRTLRQVLRMEDGVELPDHSIALGHPTSDSARCVRELREILVDVADPAGDPNHVPGSLQTLSRLFAPLAIGERVLGVMSVQSQRRHAYAAREQMIFRTLCAYGAIALDNAAAYRRLAAIDAELGRSLRDQQLILDHAAAAIFFVRDHRILRCNSGMEQILGYPPGALTGASTEIYFPSHSDWEAMNRRNFPQIAAGEVSTGECQVQRRDGSLIWMAYRGRAVEPQAPEQGTIWVAHDITERKQAEAELERVLRDQQLIWDNLSGAVVLTRDRIIVRCSRGAEEMLGYAPGTLQGKSARCYFPSDHAFEEYGRRTYPVLAAGEVAQSEVQWQRLDGTLMSGFTSGRAVDPSDLSAGVVWMAQDISEKKREEEELIEGKRKVELALRQVEATQRQVTVLSELVGYLQACPDEGEACACIAEYGPRLFPGGRGRLYLSRKGEDLLSAAAWGPDNATPAVAALRNDDCWALRRGQVYRVDQPVLALPCPHLGADARNCACSCVPLMAQGDTIGLLHVAHAGLSDGVAIDLAQNLAVAMAEQAALALANIRLREALTQQSVRDPLTSLYNRRYLQDSIVRMLGRCRRDGIALSVLMIDVDHFKKFNDTYGHHAGDHVLVEMARLVAARFGGIDVACRYGGEEFIVLLPGRTLTEAAARALELLDAVRALRLTHDNRSLGRITASLGLAQFPLHGSAATELIAAADSALYRAKQGGRDRLVTAADALEAS